MSTPDYGSLPDYEDPSYLGRELDLAYYDFFSSSIGKVILGDMFWNYFERPMFDPSEANPQALAFREGQRSVVLDIRAAIRRAGQQSPLDTWVSDEDLLE